MLKQIKVLLLKWQISRIRNQITNGNIFKVGAFFSMIFAGLVLYHMPKIINMFVFDGGGTSSTSNSGLINNTQPIADSLNQTITQMTHTLMFFASVCGVLCIIGAVYKKYSSTSLSQPELQAQLMKKNISLEALTAKEEMNKLYEKIDLSKKEEKRILL